MSSELKSEVQKTIRRLATQKNHEVLKNKLRHWLVSREVTVNELLRACRERAVLIPGAVLNKLGMLYGSGREGIHEDSDTAFLFYVAAADLGFASANGNVAQYYFDGRAPGGRNLDLAFAYCKRAIEQGADKFMLMSEILHERQEFPQTVRYLRRIIESRSSSSASAALFDYKKRLEARKLEVECLYKCLQRVFARLQSLSVSAESPSSHNALAQAPTAFALQGERESAKGTMSASTQLYSLLLSSSPMPSISPSPYAASAAGSPLKQRENKSFYEQQVFTHPLPGWFYLTADLEGFDADACASLTARAEVITLETEALKSAFMTAESQVAFAHKHKFREQIISVLMHDKVAEFRRIFETLESNRQSLLESWEQYIDVKQHVLRRQIYTEKRFFDPSRSKNPRCFQIARELAHRRFYDYLDDYLDAEWSPQFRANEQLNEPLSLCAPALSAVNFRLPQARTLVTAERALFETAFVAYGRATTTGGAVWGSEASTAVEDDKEYEVERQETGWAGETHLLMHFLAQCERERARERERDRESDVVNGTPSTVLMSPLRESEENNERKERERPRDRTPQRPRNVDKDLDEDAIAQQQQQQQQMSVRSARARERERERERERAALLARERTFFETIIAGGAVLRLRHRTHPLLAETASTSTQQTQTAQSALNTTTQAGTNTSSGAQSERKRESSSSKINNKPSPPAQSDRSSSSSALLRGDAYYTLEDLGDSDDVLRFLRRLTLTDVDDSFAENERKLASLILRFTREGRPLEAADVQLLNEDATEREAHQLTRIAFHYFVKRIVPFVLSFEHTNAQDREDDSNNLYDGGSSVPGKHRHHGHRHHHRNRERDRDRERVRESDSLSSLREEVPLASGQARALLLLQSGHLSLRELFEEQSLYGIFFFRSAETLSSLPLPLQSTLTQQQQAGVSDISDEKERQRERERDAQSAELQGLSALDRLRVQISHINALYQRAVLELTPHNFHACVQFWKRHRQGSSLPTYAALRRELREVYGGDRDSDDEEDEQRERDARQGFERDAYGADDKELERLLGKLKI